MPRGLVRCVYLTDLSTPFWLWVDRDSQADPNRGWDLAPFGELWSLPRQFLPRRVVGLDADGHVRYTRVGHVGAQLWLGNATTWSYEGTDQLLHTATVIGRQEERRVTG